MRWLLALVVFLGIAAPAWAQDYAVTKTSGLLETRPSGAQLLTKVRSTSLSGAGVGQVDTVDLPFTFPYYGKRIDRLTVAPCGYAVPGAKSISLPDNVVSTSHMADGTTGAFPFGTGGDIDGILAPLFTYYYDVNENASSTGHVYTWTTGTAPDRRFVVSWEGAKIQYQYISATATVQLHLHEASGRIVFAYSTTGDYSHANYICGIDAEFESRFTAPKLPTRSNAGAPGNDFVFDPHVVQISGTVLYDRIVSDATGIGNSVSQGEPLAAVEVELRFGDDFVSNRGETLADGSYSLTGIGVPSASPGGVVALTANRACTVVSKGGTTPSEWRAVTGVSLAADGSAGDATLTSAADSSGELRAAFHVAATIGAVRDLVEAHSAKPVAPLLVVYDPAWSGPTVYAPGAPAAGVAPSITVASTFASDPDGWDTGIVAKVYGRHVLAQIAGSPSTAYDARFDAVTDPGNAFAEGFGAALWAALSGSSVLIDGKDTRQAAVHDLETPQLTTRSASVAGAVAGALYDLVDAANEPTDTVDGTSSPARFVEVVAAESALPTIDSFIDHWIAAGHSVSGLARTLVGHGVLPDDAAEPNDSAAEAFALGAVGFRRPDLLLNIGNEDWYSFQVPAAADRVTVDVTWDRSSYPATVTLDVLDGSGATVASASPSATGPVRAMTGPLAAGTYRVALRHSGGGKVPKYALQAYLDLGMAAKPLTDWTVGRSYGRSLGVTGGVPPVNVVATGSALPPGLSAGGTTGTAIGSPTQAGTYDVTLMATDSTVPPHTASRSQRVVIAPPVDVALPAYVGFPLGVDIDTDLPVLGGTAPKTYVVTSGDLPDGLAFDAGTFHVEGRADAPGFSDLRLDATDVAGSTDSAATRAVVCVEGAKRNVALDLAAGDASCGFWVDGVVGSTLGISVRTAPKAPKRALAVTVLAPDRSVVTTGKFRTKLGLATGSRIVCPGSGRYHVVVSSESGDATQLLAGVSVAPPRRGRGNDPEFGPSDQLEIEVGALAGAKLVFKGAMPRRSDLTATCVGLLDPDGYLVATDGSLKTVGKGFVLQIDLPTAGTWTVLLGAGPAGLDPAKLSWSFSLRQPRGAAYMAE